MNKFVTGVLFCAVLLSCSKKSDDYEKLILGDWKFLIEEPVINKEDSLKPIPPLPPYKYTRIGYEFKEKGIYEYKTGFFREKIDNVKSESKYIYLGTTSKYAIENDSLKLYDESDRKWSSYKIVSLKKDTLEIIDSEHRRPVKLIKIHYSKKNSKSFDKIIISSSGCFGSCPVSDIQIDTNGQVFYNGSFYTDSTGYFSAQINKNVFRKIKTDFQKADWFNLKNDYYASHTDDETVTITFIKDNKIVKTITDYGAEAPVELMWAYSPVRELQENVKLKKIESNYALDFLQITFKDGNKIMRLSKSETFYLKNLLLKSKQAPKQNFKKYKITYWDWTYKNKSTIFSDGRFYTIKTTDGKEVTLDLGFDFLKQNGFLEKFEVEKE